MLLNRKDKQVCICCGKEFIPHASNQKRCLLCIDKPTYEKKNILHKQTCCVCGKEFETILYNKKFCGAYCRRRYHYNPETFEHICALCGTAFLTRKKQQKYCTSECRQAAALARYNPVVLQRLLNNKPGDSIQKDRGVLSSTPSLDDFLTEENNNE